MTTSIPIIVISGPTASGKTELSIELSKFLDIEIISADSRQIYKYLNIGTAKPSKEELQTVKHHFIDYLNPDEYYSAGKFGNEAFEIAENIYKNGKIPVVVGGSGLYIQSLLNGFYEEDSDNSEERIRIRQELEEQLNKNGKDYLYDELLKIDPKSANIYNDKNPRRIIRALEFYYSNNQLFSSVYETGFSQRNIDYVYFALNYNRDLLYNRINLRTEIMWENGIIEETKNVLNLGYSDKLNSLNTVGYKECISYLKNEINEYRAIELIKQNTRRYAKRQITWLKSVKELNWLDGNKKNSEKIKLILDKIKELNFLK